jgi:hypothetical protein
MFFIRFEPLSVERLTISIADLPSCLSGLKIVQLSNFHYDGLRLKEELLEEAIAKVNLERPDLIFLTGDYVTDRPQPIHQLAKRLQKVEILVSLHEKMFDCSEKLALGGRLLSSGNKSTLVKFMLRIRRTNIFTAFSDNVIISKQ